MSKRARGKCLFIDLDVKRIYSVGFIDVQKKNPFSGYLFLYNITKENYSSLLFLI